MSAESSRRPRRRGPYLRPRLSTTRTGTRSSHGLDTHPAGRCLQPDGRHGESPHAPTSVDPGDRPTRSCLAPPSERPRRTRRTRCLGLRDLSGLPSRLGLDPRPLRGLGAPGPGTTGQQPTCSALRRRRYSRRHRRSGTPRLSRRPCRRVGRAPRRARPWRAP